MRAPAPIKMSRMGKIPLNITAKLCHQVIRRKKPIMMTKIPITTPNMFDTDTPPPKILLMWTLSKDKREVKANLYLALYLAHPQFLEESFLTSP